MQFNRSPVSQLDDGGSPVVGNPETFFGTGIVAYIDLLGFSREVLKHWSDSPSSPLMRLLRIKSAPVVSGPDCFTLADCDGQGHTRQSFRHRVHTLSDSIVIMIALEKKPTANDLGFALMTILCNLTLILRTALLEGFVFRGGIEIAEVYWDGREIVGPAYVKAVELEKNACFARVLVGARLAKVLREALVAHGKTWPLGNAVLHSLRKCEDHLVALDPAQLVKSKDATRIVNNVKEMQRACRDNPKHHSKYDWMLRVFEEQESLCVPSADDMHQHERVLLRRIDQS